MTNHEDTSHTVWQLARLAGCSDPDSLTSPGAAWLELIYDATAEGVRYAAENGEQYDEDNISQEADTLVPIYTRDVWQVFVDLAAYREDLDDIGGSSGDMEQDAKVALFMIAERLIRALVDENTEDEEV